MEFSCTVVVETSSPVSSDQLEAVAQRAGVAEGDPGGTALATTLTVEATDLDAAASVAIAEVLALVPGQPIAVEALTLGEADRRLGLAPRTRPSNGPAAGL